ANLERSALKTLISLVIGSSHRVTDMEPIRAFSPVSPRFGAGSFLWQSVRFGTTCGMQASATVFSQITSVLYAAEFARCIERFPMKRPPRGLSAYDQFLALVFGQLTYRESLRDITCCLQNKRHSTYHAGFRAPTWPTPIAIGTGVCLEPRPRFSCAGPHDFIKRIHRIQTCRKWSLRWTHPLLP